MAEPYDPTIYLGTARHYTVGRPPYSRELAPSLADEAGLDGTGRLLDVGCGPGVVALELAHLFEETIGVDADAEMVAEAARRAAAVGLDRIRWVHARAEELPTLDVGTFRLVTFGQSIHWTDHDTVAESVYDLLEPGGAIALIAHETPGNRPQPPNPGHPKIPHEKIEAIVRQYLGPKRRAGQGTRSNQPIRYEDILARTRFGKPKVFWLPARRDIVRDVDGVLSGVLSMSWAAPHLFGDRLPEFEADMRAELERHSPDGLFWDWPGDTAVILGRKPA